MRRINTVGYKIRLIHNQIHKDMEAKRQANEEMFALTGMQRWTIGFMREHEKQPIYQRDIEAEFQVSRATASNMLSVMERKGLIERLPVEHDARLKQLVLTEQGRAIMERADFDMREMEEKLTRGFTPEEKKAFLAMLDRVLENLGENSKQDPRCCGEDGGNHK